MQCWPAGGGIISAGAFSHTTKDAQVGTVTTDANGNATIRDLFLGQYYVKEITPSEGYLLDGTAYATGCTQAGDGSQPEVNSEVSEIVMKQPAEIIKAANNGKTDADLLAGAGFKAWLVSSLKKNSDGSYSGSFDLDVDMIDTYWFSASGMPSVVTLAGSDSVSDCTISISAPSSVSGSEFDLIITGYAAGDPSNYTVYRPADSANKTLLYNEGKAVPVCEQTVHVVIPGSGRIRIYETNEEGGAVPYSVWGVSVPFCTPSTPAAKSRKSSISDSSMCS